MNDHPGFYLAGLGVPILVVACLLTFGTRDVQSTPPQITDAEIELAHLEFLRRQPCPECEAERLTPQCLVCGFQESPREQSP